MRLKCEVYQDTDYGVIEKAGNGSVFIEITNNCEEYGRETASLSLKPQTLYKWLTTEYDIKTLQGEAEEK